MSRRACKARCSVAGGGTLGVLGKRVMPPVPSVPSIQCTAAPQARRQPSQHRPPRASECGTIDRMELETSQFCVGTRTLARDWAQILRGPAASGRERVGLPGWPLSFTATIHRSLGELSSQSAALAFQYWDRCCLPGEYYVRSLLAPRNLHIVYNAMLSCSIDLLHPNHSGYPVPL